MLRILFALLLLFNITEVSSEPNDSQTLQVTGTASIDVKADVLLLTIGVQTENENARKALQDNSSTMNNVISALKKAGLEKGEYQTASFSINPVYHDYRADTEQRIRGYRVLNSLKITTSKIDSVGDLLSEANKAGANTVNSVRFSLKDPRTKREELIKKATQNAMEDAGILASSSNLSLFGIKSITIEDTNNRVVSSPVMKSMSLEAASDIPPLEGGELSLNARVKIVYNVN